MSACEGSQLLPVAFYFAGVFEAQRHNLQPFGVKAPIQIGQHWSLVVAVRTPASRERSEHNFVLESIIGVRHPVAIKVLKAERERHARILHARVARRVRRLRNAERRGFLRPCSGKVHLAIKRTGESTVALDRNLQKRRTNAIKMAQNSVFLRDFTP